MCGISREKGKRGISEGNRRKRGEKTIEMGGSEGTGIKRGRSCEGNMRRGEQEEWPRNEGTMGG